MGVNKVATVGRTRTVRAYFFILLVLLTTTRIYLTGQGFYFKAERDKLKCVQLELCYHCNNLMKM